MGLRDLLRLPGRPQPGAGAGASRSRRPASAWRAAAAALAALSLLVAPAAVGTTTPAASALPLTAVAATAGRAEVVAGQVTLTVDSLLPEVLTGAEDLTLTVSVANGTSEPVSGSLVVQMQRSTDMTIAALGSWLSLERDGYLRTVAITSLPEPVEPGGVSETTIRVSRDELPLGDEEQWGPRGLQVQLASGNDTLARVRTVAVWDAGIQVDPTRMTVVLPVTATPAELTALATVRNRSAAGSQAPGSPDAPADPGTTAPSPSAGTSSEAGAGSAASPVASATAAPSDAQGTTGAGSDPGTSTAQDSGTDEATDGSAGGDAHEGTQAAAAGDDRSQQTVRDLATRVTGLLSLARPGVVLAVDPALLSSLGIPFSAPGGSAAQTAVEEEPEGTASATPSPSPEGVSPAPVEASAAATASPSATPVPSAGEEAEEPSQPQQPGASTGLSRAQTELVTALRGAVAAGSVVVLPWRDADVAALAGLGDAPLSSGPTPTAGPQAGALTATGLLTDAFSRTSRAVSAEPAAGTETLGTAADGTADGTAGTPAGTAGTAADDTAAPAPGTPAGATASASGTEASMSGSSAPRCQAVWDASTTFLGLRATAAGTTAAGTAATGTAGAAVSGGQGEAAGATQAASSCDPQALTATYLATGSLDATTLDTLPDSVTTVITQPWDLPVTEDLTYTPSGTLRVGERTVLVPDPRLSATLAGALPTQEDPTAASAAADAGRPASPDGTAGLSDLTTRQLLRAQTAILTRQAPNLGRDVVVTLDRSATAALSTTELDTRLAALLDSSWTSPQNLDALREHAADDAAEGTTADRQAVPQTADQPDGAGTDVLDQAAGYASFLTSLGSVVTDPAALVGDPGDTLLATAATSWRADPDGRWDYTATTDTLGQQVSRALAVLPSSTINVIAASADLPLRLHSDLDQDATVTIHLAPSSVRLQSGEDVTVTVPAHSDHAVTVPVRAVGSGDVDVVVELRAQDGTVIAPLTELHTRVRADWESVGTRVVAIVLVVLLAAGIWRTVRRGRRSEPELLTAAPPARPGGGDSSDGATGAREPAAQPDAPPATHPTATLPDQEKPQP